MTELEILQRAKMYMDKLAQGVDPITDREMEDDTVLNNVRLTAVSSMYPAFLIK